MRCRNLTPILTAAVSVAGLAASVHATGPAAAMPTPRAVATHLIAAPPHAVASQSDAAGSARLWLVSGAGEAGEGGEGPAFDPAAAKDDPVVFETALEMAAAHYHAGRAAYAAGNHSEGAEMFAHGISEVYVDLEPALKQAGVADFKPLMEKAVELASAGKPVPEVDAAVDAVIAAIASARTHAPQSSLTPASVRGQVLAEVMNRAAHNYMIAARGTSRDAYLDGYGYRVAAEARAAGVIADLQASSAPDSVAKLQAALDALKAGYASIEHPATGSMPPGDLLVAVSKALLAVGAS